MDAKLSDMLLVLYGMSEILIHSQEELAWEKIKFKADI